MLADKCGILRFLFTGISILHCGTIISGMDKDNATFDRLPNEPSDAGNATTRMVWG
ncbi:hypothetical protein ACFQWF_08455 [Methylorubrum suomiense]